MTAFGRQISPRVHAQPWAATETNPFGLLRVVYTTRNDQYAIGFTLREEEALLSYLQQRQALREAYDAAMTQLQNEITG